MNMTPQPFLLLKSAVPLKTFGGMLVLLLLVAVSSCKPSVPSKFIQPDELEDILYGYHFANAVFDDYSLRNDTISLRTAKLEILNRYGYSEAQFDSSMVYYMRHSDRLHEIYQSLVKRFEKEVETLGTGEGGVALYASRSESGDTSNVWTASKSIALLQKPGYNQYAFTMKADSSFHFGDRLVLDFKTSYMYQDGIRNAICLLCMRLNNDSVVSRQITMPSSSSYHVDIEDHERLGIKEINGLFMLNRSTSSDAESRTTYKLLIIDGITLIRMHTKVDTTKHVDNPDTANVSSQKNNLNNPSDDKIKNLPDDKLKKSSIRRIDTEFKGKLGGPVNKDIPRRLLPGKTQVYPLPEDAVTKEGEQLLRKR